MEKKYRFKDTNMEKEHIKEECEKSYAVIRQAEERLKELRAECKHEKTYDGKYSWRLGSIQDAEICSYCGSLIRYK